MCVIGASPNLQSFMPYALKLPFSSKLPFMQACHAYASEGGRIIVVMTQREKIGMEAMFRRTLPPHKRLGSQFVFRQASVTKWPNLLLYSQARPSVPCKHAQKGL